MKSKAAFLAAALAIVASTHFGHSERSTPQAGQAGTAQGVERVEYSWFFDWDHTDYTGVTASLASELARLRGIHAGYIFSATPAMGLSAFEFGSHAIYADIVIYSNY